MTNQEVFWQIVSVAPSQKECQSLMREGIEARMKMPGGDNRMISSDTVSQSAGSTLFIRRFLCLPDTVDPRGPKAK